MELKLDFKFDAAHRLMHHKGHCHNIHGHLFRVRVTFQGIPDLLTGMIEDFKDLKAAVNFILNEFDHTLILNAEDVHVYNSIIDLGVSILRIDGEPTCENLAMEIYHRLENGRTIPELVSVQVWESDTASAIYSGK